MDYKQNLIEAMEAHSAKSKHKLSTIGVYATNDGGLYERLVSGGDCTMTTYERVMRYLKEFKYEDIQTAENGQLPN